MELSATSDPLITRLYSDAALALDALRGRRVVVGVSGGADSMVLLHLLRLLSTSLNIQLVPAHLDHALRSGSAREQAALDAVVRSLGLGLIRGREDVRALAERQGLSIEAAGRAARYSFLARLAEQGQSVVAVAHNRTDQAETVLLALARGAGPAGLTGMRQVSVVPGYPAIPLVRPLLCLESHEIRAYARSHRLPVTEDPSNSSSEYRRNVIRHNVLPPLTEVNSASVRHIAQAAELLRAEGEVLDELAGAGRWVSSPVGATLPLDALDDLPRALALRSLRAGVLAAAGTVEGLTTRQLEAMLRLAAAARPGSELHLAHGLRARIQGRFLLLTRAPVSPDSLYPGPLLDRDGGALAGGWRWAATPVTASDHGRLGQGPLHEHVRWSPGGLSLVPATAVKRVRPLGMSEWTRTLDFLARQGVPGAVRRRVPVVMLDGEPVWIMGVRITDEWRVTDGAETVLCLRALPPEEHER